MLEILTTIPEYLDKVGPILFHHVTLTLIAGIAAAFYPMLEGKKKAAFDIGYMAFWYLEKKYHKKKKPSTITSEAIAKIKSDWKERYGRDPSKATLTEALKGIKLGLLESKQK